jgi:hypothetical protein
MQDEEILTMAERMVEAMDHGLLMDTPFLRRIREEGREEGREEAEVALRQSILDVVAARFDPPASHYRRIEAHLAQVRDFARLRALLQDAIQVDELADLERELSI